mgnify:CR=1 FL=1
MPVWSNPSSRAVVRLAPLLWLALSTPATAAGTANPATTRTCLWQLTAGRGADIDCEHPAWLTEQERGDLERLTRGLLKNARCTVRIKIPLQLVAEALAKPDSVFQAPKLPVACEIETSRGPVPITGTFAPRVVFKGGKAADATPGLDDVAGVSAVIAWPVVQYVNRAPGIRTEMARMIDLYVERVWRSRSAAR